MLDIYPRKILVGVDELGDVDGVLEFAAAEAVRRGCGVHLVHAVFVGSGGAGDFAELSVSSDSMQRAGSEVLLAGSRQLEHMLGEDLTVTTEIVHGPAVHELVEASEHACLVLLQRRPRTGVNRFGLLGVVNGVAARAAVPVVVVPSSWRRYREHPPVVAVGIDEPEVSGPLVRAALELAREWHAELHLVHARPSGLRHEEERGWSEEEAITRITAAMAHDFADLAKEYPDVRVVPIVHHGEPEDALIVEGDTASLIVVGRHHRRHAMSPHLGSTARAVLSGASCPVMIVEPGELVEVSAPPAVDQRAG